MKKIFLASQSPRRKELLRQAGFSIQELSVQVSEFPNENLNIEGQVLDIARRKSAAGVRLLKLQGIQEGLVVAADTVVVIDGKILGKPKDENEAFSHLSALSGRRHEVKTAVTMVNLDDSKQDEGVVTTQVEFFELTPKQIRDYIATREPMDKAGAYGIQGLGRAFVSQFVGPYDNVVGLPMELFQKMLTEMNRS